MNKVVMLIDLVLYKNKCKIMKLINSTFLSISLLFCMDPIDYRAQAVQMGTDINGLGAGDHAGWYMSFDASGHTVAIGAMDHSSYKGCAMIYTWNGTSWLSKGSPIIGEVNSEQCGRSVKLSADGSISLSQ